MTAQPADINIRILTGTQSPSFYRPDYREDFELGDEPYRYYRW
jgi:beta-galactosidase